MHFDRKFKIYLLGYEYSALKLHRCKRFAWKKVMSLNQYLLGRGIEKGGGRREEGGGGIHQIISNIVVLQYCNWKDISLDF